MTGPARDDEKRPLVSSDAEGDLDDDDVTLGQKMLLTLGSGSKAGTKALGPSGVGGLRWLNVLIVVIVLIVALLMVVAALS